MNDYKYHSKETIDANRTTKTGCAMCQPYKVKGYVHNAGVWVRCYQCNPTPRRTMISRTDTTCICGEGYKDGSCCGWKPELTKRETYNYLVEKEGMRPMDAFALVYPEAAKAREERVAQRMKDREHAEEIRRQIRLEWGCAR